MEINNSNIVKIEIQEPADKSTKPACHKIFEEQDRRIHDFIVSTTISLDEAPVQPEFDYEILNRNDLCMSISSTKVCIFPFTNSGYHSKKRDRKTDDNLRKKNYAGFLTNSAKKKIKQKLDIWISMIDIYNELSYKNFQRKLSYITFLTLTLPATQRHSDKEINKVCLSPFIDKMKYHFDIYNYFWRAERQENGNIHYHILLDTYCDKKKVQNLWNDSVSKLGYIDDFKKLHGHENPPSTMIKAMPRTGSAVNYFVKYALKQDDEKKINGRVWNSSKSILNLKTFSTTSMISIMSLFRYLYKLKEVNISENDNNLLLSFPSSVIKQCKDNIVISQYKQYLLLLYHVLYRDRHLNDKSYEFKQYYPLDSIDMQQLGRLRKIQTTDKSSYSVASLSSQSLRS
jgi:hypothetical protein